ncbi:MAG TPA: nucleotide exchange factor GrpE [Bacteroidota bacterium]|nr:nucleotide exchange factor GrpE [Bacteroidota bacterium]
MQETNDNKMENQGAESQNQPLQIPELTELDMLSAKIGELEQSISQYKDQLLRKAAEFENYKKRTENDYGSIIKYSNEDLISKLLPVVDDFERSLKALQKNKPAGDDIFAKALELIHNKLVKILEAQGVKHFEVLGLPFDPQLHDALMQLPRSDVPPHTVIEEVEKGYRLQDKVIRHARVVVSSEAEPGAQTSGEAN